MEIETLILLSLAVAGFTTIIVVAIVWYSKFKIRKEELRDKTLVELERERTKDLNKWQSFSESLLATNKEIIEVYCKNNIKQKQEA
ncbi:MULTISPECIES: hypothetical protein [Porphyromonas]|uniref:Uncharacterized protein n=1 Tax=Porphyromonas gulae TaxID=111105 RepID=A0A0A2FER1_9PORP|nr:MULTISPECIES: hypothetical protein [Porphyromonas]ATR99469.1 hypothetical protein CS550_10130 [Porphyromonas gingivalis]KGN88525.1 hypothetical protein HR15_04900 [Porphyromonas gulae]KGN89235.1 hypothetical protein HQ46_05010 [Porphyromonas gulae]KGO02654.1 hypothetical protein HQ42_06510 [Porphyromonas gulae]